MQKIFQLKSAQQGLSFAKQNKFRPAMSMFAQTQSAFSVSAKRFPNEPSKPSIKTAFPGPEV